MIDVADGRPRASTRKQVPLGDGVHLHGRANPPWVVVWVGVLLANRQEPLVTFVKREIESVQVIRFAVGSGQPRGRHQHGGP